MLIELSETDKKSVELAQSKLVLLGISANVAAKAYRKLSQILADANRNTIRLVKALNDIKFPVVEPVKEVPYYAKFNKPFSKLKIYQKI